jgi:adenosylcobinamide amidohydrolase
MDEPELMSRHEEGADLSVALWRLSSPLLALSSAPYGGGWGMRHWILAAQVAANYSRLDPAGHLAELVGGLALDRPGIGMLTAVDVRLLSSSQEEGIAVAATVGLSHPGWAAAADAEATVPARGATSADRPDHGRARGRSPGVVGGGMTSVGTVNIIAVLARRLSPAALVNAVMTVTEAKTQALWDAGFAATGTPSDAVAVLCAPSGPAEAFAGPRSRSGSRLARAVHQAVLEGSRGAGAR